ncbi:TPA: hypothetical protein NJ443_003647 [Vibrio parahaemolyticus]|nr:hypothetical protein [Vibrio parahaemolyticus]
MSTQEIGKLIDSVNNLTQTVAGKVGEIDQRMDVAEKEFEKFTTEDFPERVQAAQTVKFFIDSINGSDTENTGLSLGSPFRTLEPISNLVSSGNVATYNVVTLIFKADQEHLLEHQVIANERINIHGWGSSVTTPQTLVLKQGFNSDGSPVQFAKAPFVFISEAHNGGKNTVFKTAEFKAGHAWPDGDTSNAEVCALQGAALRDVGILKLDGVQVELYDTPLTSQYFNNSLGNNPSLGVILAGFPTFFKKAPGDGSANYCNSPYLMHIYGVSKLPVDIVSGGHVLDGFDTFGELFSNLSADNVRTTHSFV